MNKYLISLMACLVAVPVIAGKVQITDNDTSVVQSVSATGAASVDSSGSTANVTNVVDVSNSTNVFTKLVNGNGNPIGVDTSTRAFETIDYAHHEKHAGSAYTAGIQDLDLDTAETNGLVIVVANTTKWPHLEVFADCTKAANGYVYRGVSVTTNGTEVTSINADHNSTNTAGMKVYQYSDSTITNMGTLIDSHLFGAEGVGQSGVGGSAERPESIYKQNTAYVILMVGVADNGRMNIDLDWYEHTNKTD